MNHKPVTPSDIEASIASDHYFTAHQACAARAPDIHAIAVLPKSLSLLTFCVLVTHNGHTVTGESHCQDQAKFDAEIGRTEARKDAINKLWPMAVYAERQQGISLERLEAMNMAAKNATYTWADVMSSQTIERNYDNMTAFKINMRDGRIYEGAITSGLRWPEAFSAMLAECNRQRDQASK